MKKNFLIFLFFSYSYLSCEFDEKKLKVSSQLRKVEQEPELKSTKVDSQIIDFVKTFLKLTDLSKAQNTIDRLSAPILELIRKYINAPIDQYNNTLLHEAKTAFEVQLLLMLGADPNIINKGDETPLIKMLFYGQRELAYILIQNSSTIILNQSMFSSPSPLHYAARRGYDEIIKLLVSLGADINIYYNGFLPLEEAMDHKKLDTVKLLINLGTDIYSGTPAGTKVRFPYEFSNILNIDSCDFQDHTPLMTAVMSDCPEIVELLLSYGVDVNKAGPWGFTPLMFAYFDFNPKIIELLLKAGADPEVCTKNGVTPLLLATFIPKQSMIEPILKAGAVVNQPFIDNFFLRMFPSDLLVNLKGFSPLLLTIKSGSRLSKMLIDYGANIHQVTDEGISALMLAILFEPELIPLLIEKGINVNHVTTKSSNLVQILLGDFLMGRSCTGFDKQTVSESGFSALTLAAALGKVDIVKLLIKAGANVNAQTTEGITALMFASHSKLECVKYLVEAGADIFVKSCHGLSVLDISQKNEQKDIYNYLMQR